MKIKELRELTVEELQNKQDQMWTELFGLRIKHALGQLENPLQLRSLRRDIARCKTLLREQGVEERSRRRHHAGARTAAKTAGRRKKPAEKAPAAGGETSGKE